MSTSSSRLRDLANLIADEVSRQTQSAGLPHLLAVSISRQVAASGVAPDCVSPSPFGLLVLLSHEAAGGKRPESALPAAAAFQFLVAAAEALDDLQDRDPVAGLEEQDPVAGAELIAALLELSHLSFTRSTDGCNVTRVAAASGSLSRFALVALGAQHREIHTSACIAQGIEEAQQFTIGKSGSFGRAACEAGAALATDDLHLISRIGDFGEQWAVVDQLLNDIEAVWPGGRPDHDLANRRLTVPIAFSFDSTRSSESSLRDTLLEGSRGAEPDVRSAIFKSGAIHKTWTIAAVRHARAARIADEIRLTNPQSALHELLRI